MTNLPRPRTWLEVRKLATDALQDNLNFLRRTLPGPPLTPRGQVPQYDNGRITCNATRNGVKWMDQQYFLVRVGENPRTLTNRFDLELKRFSGQKLFFAIPAETEAFLRSDGGAPVQFFFVDDTDVQLKTQLLKVMRKVDRGPLVPALWQNADTVSLSSRGDPGGDFNPHQKTAYSAMTGDGTFFIWGPPGTGKTKVISAAVEEAIRRQRNVLIASHTHVAVDNVLQKLMGSGYPVVLQNAPIAESDDPVGPVGEISVAWQKRDIFGLAGIVDRKTAEAHSHCVPLAMQYRYPSIIADIVNAFCYSGLLESKNESIPADGPTVTFVDTTDMSAYELTKNGSSWYSPGGLDLMVTIARAFLSGADPAPPQVGFVTPYAAQKDRAERRVAAESLAVKCGTSHTFQGQEVPVLIFDMMQDGRDRWAGVADLLGSERQVSAAKLLNVAITRMQKRLFIIGNWTYVTASTRPGMMAISALQGKPNFRVVCANDVLSGLVELRL